MERAELIWQYLDKQLNADEELQFQHLLNTDTRFVEQVKQIKLIHHRLTALPLEQPSTSFSDNVMLELSRSYKVSQEYKNALGRFKYFLFGILALTLGIIASVMIYGGKGKGNLISGKLASLLEALPAIDTAYFQESYMYVSYMLLGLIIMLFIEYALKKKWNQANLSL